MGCPASPSLAAVSRETTKLSLIHFPYAACAGCFLHVTSFFFSLFSFVRATAETRIIPQSLPVQVVLQLSRDAERGEPVFHLLKIVQKLCPVIN